MFLVHTGVNKHIHAESECEFYGCERNKNFVMCKPCLNESLKYKTSVIKVVVEK